MPLSADRNTKLRSQRWRNFPLIAAAVTLFEGAMASMDSAGNMRPARADATDRVVGVNRRRVANAGSAGAITGGVDVDTDEIATFANSGGVDQITRAHIGLSCYVVDDETVALTDAGGTRPRAGKIHDVDGEGVQIDFRAPPTIVVVGPLRITDVSAASDSAIGASPVAGKIRKVYSVLQGAITVADSIVTPKIGATAITGGALTIAQSGSAAGDVDFAHPTAANDVVAGSKLVASSDGGSTTTAALDVYFVIEAVA